MLLPALASVGIVVMVICTVEDEVVQTPLVTVHLKTYVPVLSPKTSDVGE